MRILSYALFHHERSNRERGHFSRFLPVVLRAARACYPSWKIVIHHDDGLDGDPYGKVLRKLHAAGVIELVDCGPSPGIAHSALWRLLPLWRVDAEYVASRDLDSVSTPRERCAVEEFIASGKCLHLINDHPNHHPPHAYSFIMMGTCAFRVETFLTESGIRRWDSLIDYAHERRIDLGSYMGDEYVINGALHHLIARGNYLQHGVPRDGSLGKARINPRPLPDVDSSIPWTCGTEYIGQVIGDTTNLKAFYDGLPSSQPFIEAEA